MIPSVLRACRTWSVASCLGLGFSPSDSLDSNLLPELMIPATFLASNLQVEDGKCLSLQPIGRQFPISIMSVSMFPSLYLYNTYQTLHIHRALLQNTCDINIVHEYMGMWGVYTAYIYIYIYYSGIKLAYIIIWYLARAVLYMRSDFKNPTSMCIMALLIHLKRTLRTEFSCDVWRPFPCHPQLSLISQTTAVMFNPSMHQPRSNGTQRPWTKGDRDPK